MVEQKMDFANVETWVKLKSTINSDPFTDPGGHSDITPEAEDEDIWIGEDGAEYDGEEDGGLGSFRDDLDTANDHENAREVKVVEGENDPDSNEPPAPAAHFPFENDTAQGRITRGQIASYAGATMSTQFRHHLFTVLILGQRARLIRWDRASAVVTESFDYTERPLLLFEYFKRFAQLDRSRRGIDPNVEPATKNEAKMARVRLRNVDSEYWLGAAAASYKDMIDIETQPFLRLRFKGRIFIVPAPHCDAYSLSPFGRATRARVAIDTANNELRYMKEYWRDNVAVSTPEATIYDRLNALKIKFVAKMECGGDTGQVTDGHNWTMSPWVSAVPGTKLRVRPRLGHRIVLENIGRSLLTFRTARQFLTCLADGMEGVLRAFSLTRSPCLTVGYEGYEDALGRAKIMHRDISVGNIMMIQNRESDTGWSGMLIDWDHGIMLGSGRPSTRIMRTVSCPTCSMFVYFDYDQQGTWQFLSAYLSENPGASHSAVDDRESALHLLVWVGLRHLEHNLKDGHSLLDRLRAFGEMYRLPDGRPVGSNRKSLMIQAHFRAIKFDLEPVQKLIKSLSLVFATRYIPMDDDTDDDVDEKDEKQTMLEAFNKLQGCLSQPEWLPTTVRRAAEQLLLHEDNITISDWVDNTCQLAEQAQEQTRVCEPVVYPLLPTRLWEGYTRSFCTSEPNPVLETKSLDGVGSSEERKSKRRKIVEV